MSSAMPSLRRGGGIDAVSCIALLALRMRVSMSATGSVSISVLLPRALRHAGDDALVGELAQADPAQAELLEHRARAAALVAARVVADLVLRRPRLLDDQGLLRHLLLPSLAGEREAEPAQERARLVVRRGVRRDRDVEATDRRHVVVVDLRKDDLLADAHRVVAASVERARGEPAEVADARQRDRPQPVQELVHPGAAQRDARADRHPLAELERRDRLARTADLRALAGDDRELLDRRVHGLRVGLGVADAHVERDLRDLRDLHHRALLELGLQAPAQLLLVELLEARSHGRFLRRGRHQLSISWPQPSFLQTRTLWGPSFVSLIR